MEQGAFARQRRITPDARQVHDTTFQVQEYSSNTCVYDYIIDEQLSGIALRLLNDSESLIKMAAEVLVWQHITLAGLHNSQEWQDYGLARRNEQTIQARPTKLA